MAEIVRFGGSAKLFGGICSFFVEGDKATVRALNITGASLYAIYKVSGLIERLIDGIVFRGFGGARDDQAITAIREGSLLVQLSCFTNDRFMEVWEDYTSGELKKRLQEEFSAGEIEVEGLTIHLQNFKEVRETRTQIESREKMAITKVPTSPSSATSVSGMLDNKRRISPGIIVQGGAYGEEIRRKIDDKEGFMRAIKRTVMGGYAVLMQEGKTAIDAVEEAVRIMEDDGHFNAGRSSHSNMNGEVECDTMIMNGDTMETGAVMAVRNINNPVLLSRKVMERTPHCALCAEGALEFAREMKNNEADSQVVIGDDQYYEDYVKELFEGAPVADTNSPSSYDSVSAVAIDANGHLACATSTGGIRGKKKGRVGDAPLVGCGGYANEFGAATSTGHGEALMKMTLARDVVFNMENGHNAQKSAEKSVLRMQKRIQGFGGAIAIDKDGNFGKAFNTGLMIWASVKEDKLNCGMDPGECRIEDL